MGNLPSAKQIDFLPWKYCTREVERECCPTIKSTFRGWFPEFFSEKQIKKCTSTRNYHAITAGPEHLTFETLSPAFKETYFYRALHEIVCAENPQLTKFLLYWTADILCRPTRRAVITPVISGVQGAGKNSITEFLKQLIGTHNCREHATMDRIFSRFNSHMSGVLLHIVNEVRTRGKAFQKDKDKLKSLVTDPELQVERKCKAITSEKNYARYWLISNNDHIVSAEASNRRYLFLKCSDKYLGKREDFFVPLYRELTCCDTLLAINNCLVRLQKDLAKFPMNALPHTAYELQQKMGQMNPIFHFVLWILKTDFEEVGCSLVKYGCSSYKFCDQQLFIRPRDLYKTFSMWFETDFRIGSRTKYDQLVFSDILRNFGFQKKRPTGIFEGRFWVYIFEREAGLRTLARHLNTTVEDLCSETWG